MTGMGFAANRYSLQVLCPDFISLSNEVDKLVAWTLKYCLLCVHCIVIECVCVCVCVCSYGRVCVLVCVCVLAHARVCVCSGKENNQHNGLTLIIMPTFLDSGQSF